MNIIDIIILALLIIQFIIIIFLFFKVKQGSQEQLIQKLEKNDSSLREEFSRNREETNKSARESREELSTSVKTTEEKLLSVISKFTELIDNKIRMVQGSLESGLEKNRGTVEKKLDDIQKMNEDKLEKMRQTVEEKLHNTLEERLNKSFQSVIMQLESVHKGLGEMQALASGVGDLKKVLTNVQSRGNLGEIQLGAILEQILSKEQFEKQVRIKDTTDERVDYVIKLPNKNEKNEALLLPVDSKFPNEDYQRLLDAYENMADKKELEAVSKQFESTVKAEAKKIQDKYIESPRTTPFALMFVPTESLFAEIVRRPSLFEALRNDYKVTVVGPTNFAAFLSSLQMGFQTLAIEKRSSEVWMTLKAVKTGFKNFGEALANTKKKLLSATNEIDNVERKSRTIERKLKSVEELSVSDSKALIGEIDFGEDEDEQE